MIRHDEQLYTDGDYAVARNFTTAYPHVAPAAGITVGSSVWRGKRIGSTVHDYLWFGVRCHWFDDEDLARRLALPVKKGTYQSLPRFPEYWVDPLKYTDPGRDQYSVASAGLASNLEYGVPFGDPSRDGLD